MPKSFYLIALCILVCFLVQSQTTTKLMILKGKHDTKDIGMKYTQLSKKAMAEIEERHQATQKETVLSQNQLQISQTELQFQKSKQVIYGTMASLVIALLLIGLLYFNNRNRSKAHLREFQSLEQQKEIQLLHAVIEGEEKERSRIAKDLHDGVAAMLAATKMQLGSLSIRNHALTETKEFEQAMQLLDDSCHKVRITSQNLMPEILIQHGLDEAIRHFCRNISNDQVELVQFASYGEIGRYSMSFELIIYRIVQELLNNMVKRLKASKATVQLNVQNNYLSILFENSGIGFCKNGSLHSGNDLNSLERRIQAMNGTLEIDSFQDQGVAIFIGIDITNYRLKP